MRTVTKGGKTGREVEEGEERGRDRKRGLRRERKSEIKEELGRCRKQHKREITVGTKCECRNGSLPLAPPCLKGT